MGKILSSGEKGHFYDLEGKACHRVLYADKKRAAAGETRPTTLADARKMNLLPSVTTVMKIIVKEGLDSWKAEQLLMAADAYRRPPQMPFEDWAREISSRSKNIVEIAANTGVRTHKAIEDYLNHHTIPRDPALWSTFRPARQWIDANVAEVHRAEFTVLGDGYAGTLDLWATVRGAGERVVDFKTRNWADDKKKPNVYDEDGTQLAGYRRALCGALPHGATTGEMGMMSVVISTQSEREVFARDFTIDDIRHFEKMWRALFELWITKKKYDPRTINPNPH